MFKPSLAIGEIIKRAEIEKIFACEPQKGICVSNKNNLIVIYSNPTSSAAYQDAWKGNILYYHGQKQKKLGGHQTFDKSPGNRNIALRDAPKNNRSLFLFVGLGRGEYIYKGPVSLIENPIVLTSNQTNEKQNIIFPLKLTSFDHDGNLIAYKEREEKALQLDRKHLYLKISNPKEMIENKQNQPNLVMNKSYNRNPEISAYAKCRANGFCDLCKREAPFLDEKNRPFLEAHHIIWLAKGGRDDVSNIVALCPNCHRKMHVVDNKKDIEVLNTAIRDYSEEELSFKD